jgi:DNA polymerase-3 subunit delta'
VMAHPDLHAVQPESKSRRIVIDQIRNLEHAIQRKPCSRTGRWPSSTTPIECNRRQPTLSQDFGRTSARSLILLLSTVPEAIWKPFSPVALRPPCSHPRRELRPEETAILQALEECLVGGRKSGPTAALARASASGYPFAIREKIAADYERFPQGDGAL